jgi:hypothetical protein
MDSQPASPPNPKRTGLTLLAGCGFGLAAFAIVSALAGLILYLIFAVSGSPFDETATFLLSICAPSCGIFAGLIASVAGGMYVSRRMTDNS